MQITLNGEKREVPENCSVDELLAFMEINPERVAVEHEGGIVRPEQFGHHTLQREDRVEIIHFVGGG